MDIEELREENNKQTSQIVAILGTGLKVGFQYMAKFPGNIVRSRKEFKESGEEYKISDIISKAHEATAETIDFEKDYDNLYSKTLKLLRGKDKMNQQALAAQGIDEQTIINGIKHFTNRVRYSRVGITVENSIRAIAKKFGAKLDNFMEKISEEKPSKFEEELKKGVPSYEEQKKFSIQTVEKLGNETPTLENANEIGTEKN